MSLDTTAARHKAGSLLSGAMSFAKRILPVNHPLHATFTHVSSPSLYRSSHSVSVVKGRAYLFGGTDQSGALADNQTHIVILPSSGVGQSDYLSVAARPVDGNELAGVPNSRKNHAAAVIGDSVFVFGGEDEKGHSVETNDGTVWVFDTQSKTWLALEPAPGSAVPPARIAHCVAASEYPGPRNGPVRTERLPQQPMDPATGPLPEPAEKDSWGTLFVSGGKALGADGKLLDDAWAFDVKSRTWSQIASPPGPARIGASLAVAGDRLFRFGGFDERAYLGGGIDWLSLAFISPQRPERHHHDSKNKQREEASSLATSQWQTLAYDNGHGPRDRSFAGLVPVSTGQGRHYLLLVGGEVSIGDRLAYFDDVWAFQLPSDRSSAANTKDNVRKLLNQDTLESAWAEVQYQYLNANGDVRKASNSSAVESENKKGMGTRGRFAVGKGTEVEGASAVVWGGVDDAGQVVGDGWMITVDK